MAHLVLNLGENSHYGFNDWAGGLANPHLKFDRNRSFKWTLADIQTGDAIIRSFFEDELGWDRPFIAASLHDTTRASRDVRNCVAEILCENFTQWPYKTGLLWSYTAASLRYPAPSVEEKNDLIASE